MKKIFTLTLVFLAMMFSVNAQYLLQEGFETGALPTGWITVDADADGYCWEGSANPASYFQEGTDLSGSGHNNSNGFVLSGSYSNVYGVLTPDNWLITPAINLTGNADLTFWICAQDASYAAEHYGVYISTTAGTTPADFTLIYEETIDANGGSRVQGTWKQKTVDLSSYTGQTVRIAFRHFNCTDMFVFNLDDVEIFAQPTDPTIATNAQNVDFGTALLGSSKNATVNVTSYNLTAAITATTTAPFSVSADGSTYGTTASVAATGGTLYLRYTPTAVGTDNGTVTLSSTGATDVTISLNGSAIECNGTIPYSYSFTDEVANQCWEVINANNDDYTFEFSPEDGYVSIRYNSSLEMDDWLISPYFTLTGDQTGSIDYRAGSSSWFEKFQIFAIGVDTVALSPVIEAHNTEYETQFFDLSSFTGNYRIAIHGVSDADQLRLYLSNFNIFNGAPQSSMVLNADTLDFGPMPMGDVSNPLFVVMHTVNVNEDFTVTVTAPYEVSLNGTTFATTQTIPANPTMSISDTIYVRFAPTAAGTFNGNLTVTSTSYNDTVALTGESVDCTPGITVPYTNDFNAGIAPPTCWSVGNDPEVIFPAGTGTEGDYAIGMEGVDYIVTPEIHGNAALLVSFDYINYFGTTATAPTYFHVGYSSTDANAASFTWQGDVLCATDGFASYSTVVPAGTKYVAVGVSQLGSGLYYGMFEMADAFYIDNFSLAAQTDPLLTVSPESISFGSIMIGATAPVRTASVVGALLTSDINVTAPANFEVSANGTSYAATATLPQAGGTLYVRYNPSAAGYHNGTITVTSGNTSKTIAVSGSAVDCSNPKTLPFTEDFEEGMPACWTILDQDGDGISWEDSYNPVSYYSGVDLSGSGYGESDGFVLSGSYSNVTGELTPDNWLITPALVIPSNGAKLTWYVSAIDADYAAEYYDVMLSTSLNPSTFTSVFNETLQSDQWEQRSVNIGGNYAGQNVYVAFRNHNTNNIFLMKIDNVSVTPGTGVENHELNTTIFPNPANNVLNINANSNINRVEVYNMMGQMVGSYNINDVNTQISTTSFANGVYTVKISTENGMSTQKFTVAR
ncbi:MAG: choice-of-anchor J domain-containing protein [Bacteroidales bacterium]|nr:choice-of-anchor J domain-containing protein [Bacteroidales bacterium]